MVSESHRRRTCGSPLLISKKNQESKRHRADLGLSVPAAVKIGPIHICFLKTHKDEILKLAHTQSEGNTPEHIHRAKNKRQKSKG